MKFINGQHPASQLEKNIRVHDKIAKKYEQSHGEIYNVIEQKRLRDILAKALSEVRTNTAKKIALDFGCGAGNLTEHMSSLGLNVLACDVSEGFLDLVASRTYDTKVEAVKLNGVDLGNIADNSIDMVATYSVLHHIPDYLRIVAEFARVVKPGGVVFIDHELSAEVWEPTPERLAFLSEIKSSDRPKWHKYLRWENYVNWLILKFINPRYRPEGDIHVFAEDHIDWEQIENLLVDKGAEIVMVQRYLLFRKGYVPDVFRKHANRTADMQLIIARKNSSNALHDIRGIHL